MIKKLFLYCLLLPGVFGIILTVVAIRLTEGFDSDGINLAFGYAREFSAGNFMDTQTMFIYYIYQLAQHSFIAITICSVWIVIVLYVIESIRRGKKKNEKN